MILMVLSPGKRCSVKQTAESDLEISKSYVRIFADFLPVILPFDSQTFLNLTRLIILISGLENPSMR